MEHNANAVQSKLEKKWREFIETREGGTFRATTMPRTEQEKVDIVSRAFSNSEHSADRLEFLLSNFAPQEKLSLETLDGPQGMEPAFGVLARWLKSDQCHVTSMYILSDFTADELACYLEMLSEARTIKVLTMQVWGDKYPVDEHAKIFKDGNKHVALHLDSLAIIGWVDARFLPLLKDMLKPPQYINHLDFTATARQDVDKAALHKYILEVQASIPTKSTKAAHRAN